MFSRHRLIGLVSVLLFLVMQASWLVQGIEHDLSPGAHKETACEFCLAMHGMGAAISGQERPVSMMAPDEYRPGYVSIVRIGTESIQPRQQGPPHFS
jgi:hypothetical protein